MTAARFKIGTVTYSTAALEEISLKDLVLFNSESTELGLNRTWADVERIATEIANLDENGAHAHPDLLLLLGVTIWASRRKAGENISFADAIDVPMTQILFLKSVEDRKPGPTKARKGKGKKPKRQGSPVADVPPAEGEAAETPLPTLSSGPSTNESSN